jgi:hypothetical protein
MIGITLGVLFTLGTAAANIIPMGHRPTPAETRAVEQAELIAQRKARIEVLSSAKTECHPAAAHELARLLVQDGQWDAVRLFGDSYEQRCGEDPVVRNWANAPRPRAR